MRRCSHLKRVLTRKGKGGGKRGTYQIIIGNLSEMKRGIYKEKKGAYLNGKGGTCHNKREHLSEVKKKTYQKVKEQ